MLNIENIQVEYPDGLKALTKVSLNVEKGQNVAVVGANGAGKSTLILSIVGIMLPQMGSISIDGMRVNKQNLREIRKKAGVVFQNPDDQLFMCNVYDDIAFGPRNYKFTEAQTDERVWASLAALGVEHLAERSSHKLSGGEKRRIAIAAVLALQPELLLLDEPTSFLDPKARRKLIETFTELPLTKLIATHDLDMALDLCEKVIVLKEGKVFAEGVPKEILLNEELMQESGLELPLSCKR